MKHLQLNTTNTTFGSIVGLQCDVGFHLEAGAPSHVRCLEDGQWNFDADSIECLSKFLFEFVWRVIKTTAI